MEPKRRLALALAGVALVIAAGGAFWFTRFQSQVQRDPGFVYREPATLQQLLKRAGEAERAGDRGTAIAVYRFVAAVGEGEGELAPYVAAARAGLRRLGAPDTLPGPPR